ncbi:MAG: type I DNA topoisomerase [Deltaproteobacteria bacterium]
MAQSVVIVESPAKARTIQKILGRGYRILSSLGHVKDLPKSRLGVDVEHDFAPHYIVIRDRRRVLKEILEAARSARAVYLAPDPDREGEAIAWHIAEAIREDAGKRREKRKARGRKSSAKATARAGKRSSAKEEVAEPEVHRVLFHEITKKGVTRGMANPRPLDPRKFDSQQARRILDRLVGYNLSPLLWKKVRRGLSAGRVQSVAVKIVAAREKEIREFVPEEYWSLTARLAGRRPPEFPAKLAEAGGEKVRPRTGEEAERLRKAVENGPFVVREIRKKMRRRTPPPPFTTSKLQQDASRRLRMPPHKTMRVAQSLYEGVEIPGAGMVGLITYMRTDSVRVADEAVAAARAYLLETKGERYLPPSPNRFRNRREAQDAHEAIRPTSLEYPPESLKSILGRDQYRLYERIWNRFLASQMAAAEFEQTTVDILCDPPGAPPGGYLFRASGSVPKFLGFLELYRDDNGKGEGEAGAEEGRGNGEEQEPEGETLLPELSEGESLTLRELVPAQHFTQPPPRFTESSLIKELEERGIGRPSTYATIVKTIRDRGYVRLEERKFLPTELGILVTDLLEKSFPRILDVAFTAKMEEELDRIEEGEQEMVRALSEFYRSFSDELERAREAMPELREELISTGIACTACGGEMVIRFGRAGRFLACRNYPECRNTANFRETPEGTVEIQPDEEAGVACGECGKPMVIRRWKGSRYLGCSGYPDCRNTRPFSVGVQCPECGEGEMVERSSRAGKLFYSCSRYPDCTMASWSLPVASSCPECGYPAMGRKVRRGGKAEIVCLRKGCRGRRDEEERNGAA